MIKINSMSAEEVLAELKSESVLNQARRIFSSASAEIEQGSQQRKPLTSIEMRNLEFNAVIRIAALMGVDLAPGRDPIPIND